MNHKPGGRIGAVSLMMIGAAAIVLALPALAVTTVRKVRGKSADR